MWMKVEIRYRRQRRSEGEDLNRPDFFGQTRVAKEFHYFDECKLSSRGSSRRVSRRYTELTVHEKNREVSLTEVGE